MRKKTGKYLYYNEEEKNVPTKKETKICMCVSTEQAGKKIRKLIMRSHIIGYVR